MDDFFLFLIGTALTVAVLAAPIVLVVTWRRTRRLDREFAHMRIELGELRTLLRKATETRVTQPAEPAPAMPSVPPPAPAPARAPEPLAPAATVPESVPTLAARLESAPSDASPRPARPVAAPARVAPRVAIDWERWLGVRGAAVVGGVFLALAAIFFFKHAFTHGWISPEARVLSGLAFGAAAIVAAARLRNRGYGWATSALEGAGVVALYASVWAADQRYALISRVVSFPAMIAITALACALALRHGSFFSALLGLAGGFLTPLLLAEHHARVLPLFAYLLVLDVGLVLVARRRGWPSLALLALGATFVYEVAMFVLRGERAALGLPIGASFAVLFALSGVTLASGRRDEGERERGRWLGAQALGVLVPFLLAMRYAGDFELGAHIAPTAAFLALLVISAALVARQHDTGWLASAAALASVAVVALWVQGLAPHADTASWELVGVAAGLALVSHGFGEWEGWRGVERRHWRTSAVAASSAWCLLLVGAQLLERLANFPALLAGLLLLAALLLRQSAQLGLAPPAWSAGLWLGLGLGLAHHGYAFDLDPSLPDPRLFWTLALALAAAALFALPRVKPVFTRTGPQAAGALLLALASVAFVRGDLDAERSRAFVAWMAGPAGVLVLLAAARLRASAWVLASVVTTLMLLCGSIALGPIRSVPVADAVLLTALVSGPTLVLVSAGLLGRELGALRWSWAFLALLVLLLVPVVRPVWVATFGERFDAAPILLAGWPAAAAALLLRARRAPNHAIGWMAGTAALAAASAIADQLDHAEFALSCALFSALLVWIARRLALSAAAWVAAASALLATLTLVGMAVGRFFFKPSEHLLVNWIAYAHLVPAACVGIVLARLPATNARGWLAHRRAALGCCVLVLLFLWLNWAIENAFTEHTSPEFLRLNAAKSHARDLTTSLAWGVYALVLLVLGTARRVTPLRWASLAVLVLSIGKVFLHDLAHLDGLWRVASLAGLALSLIGVSLFYQRFVFGKAASAASA